MRNMPAASVVVVLFLSAWGAAVLPIEWEARDAQSGELVAAGMREGRGEKLKAPTDHVTLDNYKPVLDA
jgi:hypothetical protein